MGLTSYLAAPPRIEKLPALSQLSYKMANLRVRPLAVNALAWPRLALHLDRTRTGDLRVVAEPGN